jgi:nitroreductase
MKTFIEAMNFRHACKKFDPDKKISDGDFQTILEFGRLSPSSFGMEHWRFKVVQTPAKREALRAACWNQPQVTEASHVVVICALTKDVEPGQEYVEKIFGRRNLPAEATQAYLERYALFHKTEVEPYMSTYAWSARQCYIALANMMTGAASLGIDSCPMEGISKSDVEKVLTLDTEKYEVAVVAAFGYRAGAQTPRLRQEMEALVEYL